MNLIDHPVSQFTGLNGTRHRLGYVTGRGGRGMGSPRMLVDEWEGHGLRLLLGLRADDGEAQADAVIREYRTEACLAEKPLSRRVAAEEIAQKPTTAATVSAYVPAVR